MYGDPAWYWTLLMGFYRWAFELAYEQYVEAPMPTVSFMPLMAIACFGGLAVGQLIRSSVQRLRRS